MPLSHGWAATAAITRSFAFSIATARRLLLKWSSWLYLKGHVASSFWRVAAMNSPIVSTVILAATSPAAWPPIPSATTKKPSAGSKARASSLCLRFRPTSVKPNASIRAMTPSASSCTLHADFFERLARVAGGRIPADRLLVRLLGLQQQSGLPEDRAGVLQQRAVVRLDRD